MNYLCKTTLGLFILSLSLIFNSTASSYVYTDLGGWNPGLNNWNQVSYTDAWNISNPDSNGLISWSNTIYSGANSNFGPTRMFGSFGADDAGSNTVFADTNSPKTNFVIWSTPENIRLTGVNLFASLDTVPQPVRVITSFSLYYSLTGTEGSWIPIIDGFLTNVSDSSYGAYSQEIASTARGMAAGFTFDAVAAKYFMATFREYNGDQWNGARVNELDAVTAPVPIPAAVWLLGSGLAGLGIIRRRKIAA